MGAPAIAAAVFEMLLRKFFRFLVPPSCLNRLNAWRVRRRLSRFRQLSAEETFSTIYADRLWGSASDPSQPFCSGAGSHDKGVVSLYVESVSAFLRQFPQKPDVLDLGCGDFGVGGRLRHLCGAYIAGDIVPELIEFNRKKFASTDVDFRVLNLAVDPLPPADVIFVRQVLQHLSNREIAAFVAQLRGPFRFLVLTEHLPASPDFVPNRDKPTGPDIRLGLGSGVVLTAPPFHLQSRREEILCEAEAFGGRIRTIVYEL